MQGIYLTVFGKAISLNNRINRRLDMLEKGAGREQVLEQLRKEMSQHMRSRSIPLYSILADKAQKANIAFTPQQLIMVMGVLSAVAFAGLNRRHQRRSRGAQSSSRSPWAWVRSSSGSTTPRRSACR